jgi:DNA-3-methyladenine glycosylase I
MTRWLRTDDARVTRCWWCGDDPEYVRYHDEEWGRPIGDDDRLFEKLCLEGFQCGLSWLTILRKRPRFRAVFHDFTIERVAEMGPRDVTRLLCDAGIVRHRGKIESTINNARRATEIVEAEGSLASFLWDFAPRRVARPKAPEGAAAPVPSVTDASTAMSRSLKRYGFSYVGPTTMYAFMQSVGMVNDHLPGCAVRGEVTREIGEFRKS